MTASTINTILLDLDGTIINSRPMIRKVLQILFEKYHPEEFTEDLLAQFHGIPARDVFRYIHPYNIDAIVKECVYLEERYRHLAPVYPGVQDMIEAFVNMQINLGVVTSQVREEMESVQSHYTFASYIDVWVCSDDVERPKPHPDTVNQVLDLLSAEKQSTLLIGDTAYDINAGIQAGILTGAALWGREPDDKTMLQYTADYFFSHPHEVNRLVAEKNGIVLDE